MKSSFTHWAILEAARQNRFNPYGLNISTTIKPSQGQENIAQIVVELMLIQSRKWPKLRHSILELRSVRVFINKAQRTRACNKDQLIF